MPNIDQRPYDENGRWHGELSHYYNNGNLWYRTNYVHGVEHGLDEGYYNDGRLWYRGYYNMGRAIGYWTWYDTKYYYLWLI